MHWNTESTALRWTRCINILTTPSGMDHSLPTKVRWIIVGMFVGTYVGIFVGLVGIFGLVGLIGLVRLVGFYRRTAGAGRAWRS